MNKKAPPPIPPVVPLRALREAHGLSIVQLVDRIAEQGVTVSPASITAVERGHTGASRNLLNAWARALNIKPLDVRTARDLADALAAAPPVPAKARN